MALTALQVEQAGTGKPKALGVGRHHDEHGLYLEVRKATSKSWVGRHTIAGKERWIGVGPAKDITLKRARELHAENRRLVAEGIDPIAHRAAQVAAAAVKTARLTVFEEVAQQYIKSHADGWRNPKHRRDWPNSLSTYVYPLLGKLPPQEIDTAAAMRVLEQPVDNATFWRARPETASRVRGRCEQIWDAARVQGYCQGENPFRWRGHLDKLLPAKSKVRAVKNHASVPYREMPALMAELRMRESISARALEFTILTACRTNEVLSASWGEFSLDTALWTIPKERMKAGREHVVPLSKRALEILTTLPARQPGVLVWGLSGAALSKMLALLGRSETVHGFRSSFKTWASERTTFRDAVSEACLAHIEGDKVKAAYDRATFEQHRRELMEVWSAWCMSTPGESAKVVPIRSA